MNIVSGVRSVLPVSHRETEKEKVMNILKTPLKGIQMVKGKSNMHHLPIKAPAKSTSSLEPNFIITWDNQNEKTLSQSHFDEGLLFPVNYKIICIFCYFCKQIIWQLWISRTKSAQYVFIIRAWIDWKSTFTKIQCSLQYNGFCHFCHLYK